jgi:hypothetical protein
MAARWAAATVRLEPAHDTDESDPPGRDAQLLLLRVQVRTHASREVIGPLVVDRREAARLLLGVLDGISEAFWPSAPNDTIKPSADADPVGDG